MTTEMAEVSDFDMAAGMWEQLEGLLGASAAAATPILYVTKELLANAQAANAAECTLLLRRSPDHRDAVEIHVLDNGCGFEALVPGLGLLSCAVVSENSLGSCDGARLRVHSKGPRISASAQLSDANLCVRPVVGRATREFIYSASAAGTKARYALFPRWRRPIGRAPVHQVATHTAVGRRDDPKDSSGTAASITVTATPLRGRAREDRAGSGRQVGGSLEAEERFIVRYLRLVEITHQVGLPAGGGRLQRPTNHRG
jgi:hypothetical protein